MNINFDKKSDLIQIIAPAGGLENHQQVLQTALEILSAYDFKVKINTPLMTKQKLAFYANDLESRINDFINAIDDPSVRIIWSFRGGYGSSEVAHAALGLNITSPKILIGFSDITALHVFFNQQYLIPSIHGNNIHAITSEPNTLNPILEILSGSCAKIPLQSLNTEHCEKIQGIIVGGNLTLLQSLIGTKMHPNFDDKILIIEDVNEPGYKIMRILMQMHYAGMLQKLKAVVIGDFTGPASDNITTLEYFFHHYYKTPTFIIKGFGHGLVNIPIPLGSQCILHKQQMIIYSPFTLEAS